MKFTLCTVFILVALLVPDVRGQENEDSGENSYEDNSEKNSENDSESNDDNNSDSNDGDSTPWWTKLFKTVKQFFRDIMALFRQFRSEFEEKTKGIVIWTEKMWAGMKKEMNQWIDDYDDATDEEKDEMRLYIERLQMPKESEGDE